MALYDASGAYRVVPEAFPDGSTVVSASSGNVAAAVAAATIPAVVAKTNYLTGFAISGAGATAGLPVTVTITGVLGGTQSYTYVAAAGVLVANVPLVITFPYPLQATGTNVAIVVSCPSLGIGNTNNTTVAYGYVK